MDEPQALLKIWMATASVAYDYNSNGNILTDDTILEQNDYYPFGLRTTRKQTYITLSQSLASATAPRYLYNGKEKQEFIHNTNALINVGGSSTYTSNYLDYGARLYNPVTIRWNTQDPMAEKYQRYSPYNYCVNNPIIIIDAKGRDPIYAKNFWGRVKLIGDDGKKSTSSYFVMGSVARKVKKASKAGLLYNGDLSESKQVLYIPTGPKMEGVKQSYEDTKESKKENGGHSNIGDTNVTRWDEGEEANTFTDKDGNQIAKASLKMFMVNGKNIMPTDASNVEMWWHVHPNAIFNGISLGKSTPSAADYRAQQEMTKRGYKGNTFVIGVASGTVTFFDEDGILATIKLLDFFKIRRQEK